MQKSDNSRNLFHNSVCLIVTKTDAINIKQKKYRKISLGLQEIIFALSNSENIHQITIGIIDTKSIIRPLNKLLKVKSIFNCFFINISSFIDELDFKLNGYISIKNCIKLTDERFQVFLNKVNNEIELEQNLVNFFSYTSLKDPSQITYKFDFFIRGSGLKIERGELLNKFSKYGILSLHHGDNRLNRGGPVGFWEVYFKENSGITVQFLTEELDGGKIVYIASLGTIPNPLANSLNIYSHTAAVFEVALSRVYSGYFDADQIAKTGQSALRAPYFRKILKAPNFFQRLSLSFDCLLRTLFKIPLRIKNKMISRYINPYEKWGVALTSNVNKRFSKWNYLLADSSQDWYADPFFVFVENQLFIITEKFIYQKNKGILFSYPIYLQNGKYVVGKGEKLLENDFHLSYPFTFKKNNDAYMIPENNKNGCWLYKLELKITEGKVHLEAKKIKKLLSGYAIDPTLISYEGYDYLFVSRLNYESQYVLNVFITSDIVNNDCKPHPQSPLVVDVNLGRSAGRIFFDEKTKLMIRPSQICENSYGEGIAFSELRLSPNSIVIKQLINKFITPKNHKEFKKVHHIDKFRDLTALDFVR